MPFIGTKSPQQTTVPYFKSLKELDDWATGRRDESKLDGLIDYIPRPVCHDYKGGYTESPFSLSYTFNYWSTCEAFIYFAHHRITVPPPGWVNAAHRQGVKVLGTIIFEGGGEEDCLRLLVGKMPSSSTGPAEQSILPRTLPISPYYARLLAELAHERGFDGYLLNFECPLAGNYEQTRALAAWITILQNELLKKVGPHAEAIWYDSVVINGQLAWQDRLNSLNLPFFLSSTGLFTNYTWRSNYPQLTADFFNALNPSSKGHTSTSAPYILHKSVNDIFIGIDVWGRGQHGGGGLGCYRALDHIKPATSGLSVALFGHAWTWESEQDKEGWNWDKWWEYETTLWAGPSAGKEVAVPDAPRREDESECPHGAFAPVGGFFSVKSPPDPYAYTFCTTFCPGVGRAWFVNGVRVFDAPNGWTDVDKQESVGDLVWPHPKIQWEDERDDPLPKVTPRLVMNDAWNGGSALSVTLSDDGSDSEIAAYRCIWIPVQSISVTPGQKYDASAVYKLPGVATELDVDVALSARPLAAGSTSTVEIEPIGNVRSLSAGWHKLSVEFTAPEGIKQLALGLLITIVTDAPTPPLALSVLLGQLVCAPHVPPELKSEHEGVLLWADFESSSSLLTWEAAACLPRIQSIAISTPEDKLSAWKLQPSNGRWFPEFLYFNVYMLPYKDAFNVGPPEEAKWIGTSGMDGRRAFTVVRENLGLGEGKRKVRFLVQGVTDRGEVLVWRHCVFVDIDI
ncbi:glycoside hydrolase family 85 protein [Cyathus striatus]|nr:glycoside hydrolase family 85 protein [Cyathus striatus]